MHFKQPIGEIEYDLHRAEKAGSGGFQIAYHRELENMIIDALPIRLQPSLHVNASQFRRILDAVRKIVLEWSLKLEVDGILGNGMTFSGEEKARAQEHSVTYNIKNIYQGTFDYSQIQVEAISSTHQQAAHQFDPDLLRTLVAALKEAISQLPLEAKQAQELDADITAGDDLCRLLPYGLCPADFAEGFEMASKKLTA